MRLAVAVRDEEVYPALAAIKIERAHLMEAARYGEWGWASSHPYDTPTFAGQTRHTHIIRQLAILYVPIGWSRVDARNASFILSPDGKTAITTARGDANTGSPHPHLQPRTIYPKGIVTATLAVQNVRQVGPVPSTDSAVVSLFPELDIEPETPDTVALRTIPEDATVYCLLIDRRGTDLVAELSVPVGLDDAGHVAKWYPRILLGTFPIGEPASDEPAETVPVDIDITPTDLG